MKRLIGLDMRGAEPGFKAHFGRGTGRYISELSKALIAEVDSSSEDEVGLKLLGRKEFNFPLWQEKLLHYSPIGRVTIETQVFLPMRLKSFGVDLVHFFAHGDAPAWANVPYLVTVLDLIPLKFPDLYKAPKADWRYKLARFLELRSIRGAKGIITISECSKRDIVDMLGIAPENVFVTPLAVGEEFSCRPLESRALRDYKIRLRTELSLPLQENLLLYVGGIDPRKNFNFLLDVLIALRDRRQLKLKSKIVLVGNIQKDKGYPDFRRQVDRLGLGEDVIEVGYVDTQKLPSYFRASDIFTFPSLYEGFGLPVLEAMSCGLPVIAGDNSSMPEVSGESAVLVRDKDVNVWAGAIEDLLNSEELQIERSFMGVERAKQFSWRSTAEKTLDIYRHFLSYTHRE